ncbi:MAG: RusA family crossover junction endodeoxyribonuclease [Lachnospiraceae bacterium]|nr:RusA family crossover junction endodeoxyribonuclease [Lachnospiraceae bacterium]
MEYVYEISGVPSSLNKFAGRMNSWEYRNEKKEWERRVYMACMPRPKEPVKKAIVKISYYFPTGHRHDPDNYAGKMILDGLVKAGILEDDSFNNIELTIRKGGVDKRRPRTIVRIKEQI